MKIIEASQIRKKYNASSIRDDLATTSLTIHAGCIYVIKGKSGSGKTTLLNILGGMDPPTSGKVYVDQQSFYDLPDKEQSRIRNKKFGFIFQSFNLIPELTVYDNIQLPKYFNSELEIHRSDIVGLADELGIVNLLQKRANQLSGGEQQRVAIARALITNPEIIFADEPTGNLDAHNSKVIADLLSDAVMRRNATLVLVTHEECLMQYDHINLTMSNGELMTEV